MSLKAAGGGFVESTPVHTRRSSKRKLQTALAKKKTTRSSARARQRPEAAGALVLNERQFQHFYECMTKPKPLTDSLKSGIQKLRELSQKK